MVNESVEIRVLDDVFDQQSKFVVMSEQEEGPIALLNFDSLFLLLATLALEFSSIFLDLLVC